MLLVLSLGGYARHAQALEADNETSPNGVVTDPGDGEVLRWSPLNIVVQFPAGAQSAPDVELTDATGAVYPPAVPTRMDGSALVFANPELRSGTYTLKWGGPHEGSLSFRVDIGGLGAAQTAPEPSPPSRSSPVYLLLSVAVAMVLGILLVRRSRRHRVAATALLVAVAAMVVAVALYERTEPQATPAVLDCAPAAVTDKLACLTGVVTEVLETQGVSAAMESLAQIDSFPVFADVYGAHLCHDTAHLAGRHAAAFYGSITAALDGRTTVCDNGYLHGVVEGGSVFVSTETFAADARTLCGAGTDSASLTCSHGLGHGAASRLNSRPEEASAICWTLPNEQHRRECLLGVMMRAGEWLGNGSTNVEDPADISLPGQAPGVFADLCFRTPFSDTPSRLRNCLEGMFFYVKAGTNAISRLPESYRSPTTLANWCYEQAAANASDLDACFAALATASVLFPGAEPSSMLAPCDLAPSDESARRCAQYVVFALRNSTARVPDDVLDSLCASSPARLQEYCARAADEVRAGKIPTVIPLADGVS